MTTGAPTENRATNNTTWFGGVIAKLLSVFVKPAATNTAATNAAVGVVVPGLLEFAIHTSSSAVPDTSSSAVADTSSSAAAAAISDNFLPRHVVVENFIQEHTDQFELHIVIIKSLARVIARHRNQG